ncbi:MAG: hypothetical protein PVF41_04020 [Methyloceanibacter sp.]|jgi:hypothetical protein
MVWIMRGLVAIALALGLVIVIVVLIGNIGSGDDGTQVTALTVGERTVTVTGHYATLSQESLADGVKVIVEGHGRSALRRRTGAGPGAGGQRYCHHNQGQRIARDARAFQLEPAHTKMGPQGDPIPN